MSSAIEAILTAAITVTLAGAVGYGLFRLISPRNEATNPSGLGRRWFAWTAMIVSFATLPPFFRLFDANSIAKWLVALVVFGGLAFGFGWLYGRFFKFNAAGNGNSLGPDEAGPQATNGTKASDSEPKTHYYNLQVAEDASPEVIKGAYKYLAQKWHPDRNPDNYAEAERITRLINEAYVVLSDPQLRKEHDQWIRSEREKARSNSYPDRSQQSSSASWTRGGTVRRLVAVSAVFIAVVAAGVLTWDYTIKAANRDLCIDLARFIADLHKTDLTVDPAENPPEHLQVFAFRATELVGSASRRLERWQNDSNEDRRVVVRQMELALSHYRRLAEVYHAMASGNFDSQEAIFAEMNVKSDAGADALFEAVASAAMGFRGPNALRLSASGRREIRETVERLFATELAQSRNDPQYKARRDVWAAIYLHRYLK